MLRAVFLALALATPAAVAQTDPETVDKLADQYGDFAPAEEERRLDELLPESNASGAAAEATTPDGWYLGTAVDEPAAETAPSELAQDTPAAPGPNEIPEGWDRHEAFGLTFAAPSDWEIFRESERTFVLAAPGTVPQEGKGLGLGVQLVDTNDYTKQFLEDETVARLLDADTRPALPVGPGIAFDRFAMQPEDTGKPWGTDGAISPYRHAEYGHHLINFFAFDPAMLDEKAALIERIYATLRLADPEGFKTAATLVGQDEETPAAAEPFTTLGGLVRIRVPEDWELEPGEDEVTLKTSDAYSAYVTLRRGEAALAELGGRGEPTQGALGVNSRFERPPEVSDAEILDQPALLYSGALPYKSMQVGTRYPLRGEVREYVLKHCLPDGSPIMIEMAAPKVWLEKNDLVATLDRVAPDWPEGMQPCHPAITARAEFAFDNMFAFVPMQGFEPGRSRSSFRIRTTEDPYASLSVGKGQDSFPSGFQLASSNPTGNGFVSAPQTRQTEIMGERATLFIGRGQAGEGSRVRQVALLDRCLPEEEPVVVMMTTNDAWLRANGGVETLLDTAWLLLPENARPCDPALLETAMQVSGAGEAPQVPAFEIPAPAETPGTDARGDAPEVSQRSAKLDEGTPPGWVRHEKFGLSVAMPSDWTLEHESDEKIVLIPQGTGDESRLQAFIALVPGESFAREIMSQPAVRKTVLSSGVTMIPIAPDLDFLKFIIDKDAIDAERSMLMVMSQRDLEGRGHPVFGITAPTESELRANMALVNRILGTLRVMDLTDFKARTERVDSGFKPERISPKMEDFAAKWGAAPQRVAQGDTPVAWTRYHHNGVSLAVPDAWSLGPSEEGLVLVNPETKVGVAIQTFPSDTARDILEKRELLASASVSDIRPIALAADVVFLGFIPDPNVFDGIDPSYWLLSRRNMLGTGHPLIALVATGETPFETLEAELQTFVDIIATARLVDPQDFRARGIPIGPEWQLDAETSGSGASRIEGERTAPMDPGASEAETVFWQSIAESDDRADFEAYLRAFPNGTFAPLARNRLARPGAEAARIPAPSTAPSAYHAPARGTAERAALMDAARVPVQRALGLPVIFMVSTLRSDDNWAYLAATPLQPDGQALDWSRTPMARDWAADMMSDLVLVVMRRGDDGWQAVEHIIGPTDVAWLNWVDQHGWPRALFAD